MDFPIVDLSPEASDYAYLRNIVERQVISLESIRLTLRGSTDEDVRLEAGGVLGVILALRAALE